MTAHNCDCNHCDCCRRDPMMEKALAFYDAELRAQLEPAHFGKEIVIEPVSLDYEVDARGIAAFVHMNDRHPGAPTVSFTIGYDRPRNYQMPDDFPAASDADPVAFLTREEIAARNAAYDAKRRRTAQELEAYYNAELRPQLEASHKGHFLFIDAKSRDYEVDADFFAGKVHLEDRQPDAEVYCFDIGYDAETSPFHGQRIE